MSSVSRTIIPPAQPYFGFLTENVPQYHGRIDRSFYNPRWASEAQKVVTVEAIEALFR
jgi:hypothetical protein